MAKHVKPAVKRGPGRPRKAMDRTGAAYSVPTVSVAPEPVATAKRPWYSARPVFWAALALAVILYIVLT